jgi:hypothetical protein
MMNGAALIMLRKILDRWLPLVTIITILCALVYLMDQQVLRMSANDPQIQLAEDGADALAQGASAQSLLPANSIDVAKSLASFIIVYNDAGEPTASSGLLHGKIPTLPVGVLDYVRKTGEDRVTWQPEGGVRIATVVVRASGNSPGFVLVGRSLRETEKRVDQLNLLVGAAWLAALSATMVVVVLSELIFGEKKSKKYL